MAKGKRYQGLLVHIKIFPFLFLIHIVHIHIILTIVTSIIFIVIVYIFEKQLHAIIRIEQFT